MTGRRDDGSDRNRTVWIRREPRDGEALVAGAVALATGAAVGGAVLYLARMFLARDELVLGATPVRDAAPEQEGSSG